MKLPFSILFLLLLSFCVCGQSSQQIERELVAHIKNIQAWSEYGHEYDPKRRNKLGKENEIFKAKVLKYARLSSTLKYKFTQLSKYLKVNTSKDKKFRVYSWDTEEGGTMHFFVNVYQYQDKNGKVYSRSDNWGEDDPGGFVSDIYSLDTAGGRVYLVRFSSILSTSLAYQSIDLFRIDSGVLKDKVRLIKTRSGLTNSLGFEYDFFSVVDREERPIKLILYDEAAKTIKLPVVIEDKDTPQGRVTDKFIVYKFNGKYFVKIS